MANRVRVAAVADVLNERVQGFRVGDLRVAVAQRNGTFVAFDDRCPHRGALLSRGELGTHGVSCPLHSWVFRLDTGSCNEDPSLSLQFFDTFVSGGDLFIELPEDTDAPANVDGLYRYLVRYGALGWVADFASDAQIDAEPRTQVIVQTSRGTEHGELLVQPRAALDPEYTSRQPAGRLLRLASAEDLQRIERTAGAEIGELDICRARVAERKLDLEVIDSELLLDGQTVVLYYLGGTAVNAEQLAEDLTQDSQRRVLMQSVFDTELATGGGCSGCSCGTTPTNETAGSNEC